MNKIQFTMMVHQIAVKLWEDNEMDQSLSPDIKRMSDSALMNEMAARGHIVITLDDVNDIKDTMESWKL
jgi:hypothetical protein